MSESPRELFFQAVKPTLESMTGVRFWGGAYQNPPRVEFVYEAPELQNYHPYIALVEPDGSGIVEWNHDGSEEDDFLFSLYGQMTRTSDVSARQWVGRLRHDCMLTLRRAIRNGGALVLPHIRCMWMNFGREEIGYDETSADFVLPCTARLSYTLAVTHL